MVNLLKQPPKSRNLLAPKATVSDIIQENTIQNDKKKSLAGIFLGGLKDYATNVVPQSIIGGAKGVASTVSGMSGLGQKILQGTVGKALGQKPQPVATLPSKYTEPSNEFQAGGKAGEQIAEMFLPVGAGKVFAKAISLIPKVSKTAPLITKVAQKAVKIGVESLVSGAEFGGKTLLQTGDTEKAKQAAIIAGIVPPVASLFKTAGRAIAEKTIPLSSKEAKIVQAYRAKTPFWERVLVGTEKTPITAGKTAFDKKLMGTESMIGTGAKKGSNNLWNNLISPQLKKSTVKVDMPEFFKEAEKQIIAKNPEKSMQKSLLEALSSFKENYAGVGKVVMEDLQKFKEGWAKNIPEKVYMGKPITGAANNVKDILAKIARNNIYNALGPEAKQAYFDYGNLIGLQELGQKAMTGGKLKGGAGSFISALASMALTPIGTIGGRVIYKTGQGIEMIGKQGAKTVTDLLKSFNEPKNK